jgi:hypothetical protein
MSGSGETGADASFHKIVPTLLLLLYYYGFFWLPSRMLIDLSLILFHNIFSTMSTGLPIDTSGVPISIEGVLHGKQ